MIRRTETSPLLRVWSDEQCEKEWQAILKVLSETGCRVKSRAARELLEKNGCAVDGDLVKIPASLMEAAVESAPKSITLYNRRGEEAMVLDGEHLCFGPPISTVFIRDPFTGERRRGVRADARNAGLICDALPNVDWASAMCGISDGVSGLDSVYEVYELLQATEKPVMYWAGTMQNLKTEFEMLELASGGAEALASKPSAICLMCPMEPLTHNEDGMEQIIYLAEKNAVPVYIAGCSLGCTVPATAAGCMAVGVADTLVGLLVSQLTRKGAPFILSSFCDNMDMRSMTIQRSHPEMLVTNSAVCSVLRYLGVPFCVNLGDTDSGIFDEVMVFDAAMALYTGALCGAPMIMSMGGCESCNMTDYIGTVCGSDMVEYIRHVIGGAEVNEEMLALEDIDETGPGGNFIMTESTQEFCHACWKPGLMEARTLEQFRASGDERAEDRYCRRIREIIEQGPQHTLDAEVKEKLDALLAAAEEEAQA